MRPDIQEIITIGDQHYVRALSSFADDQRRVLLSGETFAVFDRWGDFQSIGSAEFGLFHCDTRYLSTFELRINGRRPVLLSSTIRDDNALLAVDLTNPEMGSGGQVIGQGTVHIFRTKFLWQDCCFERIRIENYGRELIELLLSIRFGSDFADIFEVRGATRSRRGRLLDHVLLTDGIQMAYEGLDQVVRATTLRISGSAAKIGAGEISWTLRLKPEAIEEISISTECRNSGEALHPVLLDDARDEMERAIAVEANLGCDIYTDNEQFNDWVNRSKTDLQMLTNETGLGPYPYAGVPWYNTVFGRDGIITAFQVLWTKPQIAAGVLRFLARTQAKVEDAATNAQPGKIVHEIRKCEMARLGEVPFQQYYGTVDATPLFLFLAASYFQRTDDFVLIREIWPQIEMALAWIDNFGDVDGDGFVEYCTKSRGLRHQGWKDSDEAVFHADGTVGEGPIALCEVQAYVFAAKQGIAAVARRLGKAELAERLMSEASRLSVEFERAFWCDPIGMYALALDGRKRQCAVRSSNAGQCLFSGIGSTAASERMIEELGKPEFFSGWGIRTIASSEKGFNPMSYHNGSIWPHDNSLIALGAALCGKKHLTRRVFAGLFEAATFFESRRLPELFCGFPRLPRKAPTLYPVACSPQAWAAGSVFLLLQSCLGLNIEAEDSRITLRYPNLPESITQVHLKNLSVGNGSVDLLLTRNHEAVSVGMTSRTGKIDVVMIC